MLLDECWNGSKIFLKFQIFNIYKSFTLAVGYILFIKIFHISKCIVKCNILQSNTLDIISFLQKYGEIVWTYVLPFWYNVSKDIYFSTCKGQICARFE